MALDILCSSSGINGGTTDCPVAQGVGKFLITWSGKLTPSQLLTYTATKAALIADSKKSKNNSSKLVVFPILRDFKIKKEANTEVKLADGYSQVVREGLPAYDLDVISDVYLTHQLRKLNNKRLKYLIVDASNLCGGTIDASGNFVGRKGKLFTDGLDFHGYDKVDGQTMVTVTAEDASESYDSDKYIQLDKSPSLLFSALKDIYLYEKATATTVVGVAATATVTFTATGAAPVTPFAPTRTVTITSVGADGDTILLPIDIAETTFLKFPATIKTASETTVTLLAAKIVSEINAATSSNGGATATNAAGVITITGGIGYGATYNGTNPTPSVTGTITATSTNWVGGVTAASGNTVNILSGLTQLTSGVVERTSDITTTTLLATKVAASINTNTATNGGYTATSAANVVTVSSPAAIGGTLNGTLLTVTPTGTMTATNTAFIGGVSSGLTLFVSGKMDSPIANKVIDFYTDYSASALGTTSSLWKLTNTTTSVTTSVTSVAPNVVGGFAVTVSGLTTGVTYTLNLDTPDVLDAANVIGIEGNELTFVAP